MTAFISDSCFKLSPFRKNSFAIIAITITILTCYSNTFNASWHLDDEKFLNQKQLHPTRLIWPEIKKIILQDYFNRPVASLSLAINYYLGKDNVFGYHLINQSIHIITSFFLFLFIHNMLNLPSLRSGYKKNAYAMALLSTILWTISPVHTQAVTYIIQRMASMAGMFYIMAMYLYLKGRSTPQINLKIIFYFLCAIAFIFSLGSKENSILLPISLLFFEILVFRKNSFHGWFNKNIRNFLIAAAGIIVITFLYLYFIKGSNPFSFLDGYKYRVFSLKERVLTEPRVILFYISLLLYPIPSRLCLNHDISVSHSLLNPPGTLLSILAIMCMIIGSLIISRRWPLMAFCILFFFLNHLVESTVIPLELIFEHRNYIPSMFLFIPPAFLLIKAISSFSKQRMMRNIIVSSIIFLLISLGHSTYIRNFVWKTEESLWLDCIEKYPNLWRPFHNLGKYYSDTHQKEKAIMMYNKALNKKVLNNRLDQNYFATYFNLGVEFFKTGLYEKSMYHYLKAEISHPEYGPLQNNIGLILLKQKKYKDAETRFKQALRYQPDLREAQTNLSSIVNLN
ncbi:tetratricopeptide repeat protein [Thermodesulfobacteriota bacterium]